MQRYREDGLSGGFGSAPTRSQKRIRPQLRALCDAVNGGTIDFVAVYDLGRLSRSIQWFASFLNDTLVPTETRLLCVDQRLDIFSANGRAMAQFITIINTLFRESTGERLRDAMRTRRDLGLWLGLPPYGWRREAQEEGASGGRGGTERRGIEPDPKAAQWVQWMVQKYLAGVHLVTLTQELNTLGVAPPSRHRAASSEVEASTSEAGAVSGGVACWTTYGVLNVLLSPAHAGLMWSLPGCKGELVPGRHFEHRFYEPGVYDAIQARRQHRVRARSTNSKKANSPHLLNGLVRCSRCGSKLQVCFGSRNAQTGTYPYRFYRCQNGVKQAALTCPSVSVRAEPLEVAVAREVVRLCGEEPLRELLREEALTLLQEQAAGAAAERARLEHQLAEVQSEDQMLVRQLLAGRLSEADFDLQRPRLEQQKARLREELEALRRAAAGRGDQALQWQQVDAALERVEQGWERLSRDEQREVLDLLVEELRVDRHERDVQMHLRFAVGETRRVVFSVEVLRGRKAERPSGVESLTPRQLAVLYHMAQGRGTTQVADAMGITKGCLYSSRDLIRKALGVQDLAEAVTLAQERIAILEESLPLWDRAPQPRECPVAVPRMTPKLRETLDLALQGHAPAEIARQLETPLATVSMRLKRALLALGAKNLWEAHRLAYEQGTLDREQRLQE